MKLFVKIIFMRFVFKFSFIFVNRLRRNKNIYKKERWRERKREKEREREREREGREKEREIYNYILHPILIELRKLSFIKTILGVQIFIKQTFKV